MEALYPLKFDTLYKDKIWGGNKIKTVLGKDFGDLPNCGETWEISGVEGNVSVVAEGALKGKSLNELIKEYRGTLVGEKVYAKSGNEFPLLVKFIDANDDLSIQVHPDDELATKRHNSLGKTEMWYIFQADEGSSLISGFNQPLTKEQYLEAFNSGKLTDVLNRDEVKAGDCYFLPAGRVHTIGKGLLLAEIQQSSDVTYRIYDFDRRDDQGNLRELHVEEAVDAIDYSFHDNYKTDYTPVENEAVELVDCEYFTTDYIEASEMITRDYSNLDSFVIYVCMQGGFTLDYEGGSLDVKIGESILLPANIKNVKMTPKGSFKILESYIR